MRRLHERALPGLGNNIKCGNSLIGPDFYDQRQMTLLDEDERYRINASDWQGELPGPRLSYAAISHAGQLAVVLRVVFG